MRNGFYKLYWDTFDNPAINKDKDHMIVWFTLLGFAAIQEIEDLFKGESITIHPGQLIASLQFIADKSDVDAQKVRRIINRLKSDNLIDIQTSNKNSLISILCWNKSTFRDKQNNIQMTNKRQTNQDERKDRFDEFWTLYPKKNGKKEAHKSWSRIKPSDELFNRILDAVRQAKLSDQWQRDNGRYIPNPATWLNQERWDDVLQERSIGGLQRDDRVTAKRNYKATWK